MDLVIVGNFLLFSCFEVIFADLQSKRMGMCNRREKADLSLSLSLLDCVGTYTFTYKNNSELDVQELDKDYQIIKMSKHD